MKRILCKLERHSYLMRWALVEQPKPTPTAQLWVRCRRCALNRLHYETTGEHWA